MASATDSDTVVWENTATGDATALLAGNPDKPSTAMKLNLPRPSNAVLGDGFVAYLAADGVQVAATTFTGKPRTLFKSDEVEISPSTKTSSGDGLTILAVPCRVAASGDLVAFCETSENRLSVNTIRFVRVTGFR